MVGFLRRASNNMTKFDVERGTAPLVGVACTLKEKGSTAPAVRDLNQVLREV